MLWNDFSARVFGAVVDIRQGRASGAGDSAPSGEILSPVAGVERFHPHARPGAGAVYEAPLPQIHAGVEARPRDPEHHDIPGEQIGAVDGMAGSGLRFALTRHGDAVLTARPLNEAGAVEAAFGGNAALAVELAYLASGGRGDGRPSGIRGEVGRDGAFPAGQKKRHEDAEGKGEEDPGQR